MSALGQSPAEVLAEWRRTRRGPGRIPNHIKAIITQLEGDRNPPSRKEDDRITAEPAPNPMTFSAPVIQEQAIIGLPQDVLEQQAMSEPPAKFQWVSKTVAANAAAKASQWNAQILRQRRDRGPFYVDPHTRAVQVVSSWVVPLVIPENWDELAKEQRAEQERQERVLALLKEETPLPPKQPVTAFFHYSNAQRATIKAKYPVLGLTEIARIAGEQWRVMDDSERYHWEQIAEDDKRRFNEEMKAHRLRIEERNRLLIEMTPQLDLSRSSATLPANDAAEQKRLKTIQRRMNDPDPACELCGKGKKQLSEELLHCRQCWHRFHPSCLELPAESVQKIAEINDWRCSDCKVCEVCRGPGNEDKLLFCDSCDRGTHTFCLKPPLARPPAGGWRCSECVMCKSCNAKAPGNGAHSRWHADYTLCDACYQLFQDYKYCPICMKVYRHNEKTPMVQCDSCNWWVHSACDNMSQEQYEALSKDGAAAYTCPLCRSGNPPLWKRDDSDGNRRRIRDGQDEVVFDQQLRKFVQKAKPPPDPSKPPDFSVNAFYVRPSSHKRGAAAAARATAEAQAASAKGYFELKVKEIETKKQEEDAKKAEEVKDAPPPTSPAKRKVALKQSKKKVAKDKTEDEDEDEDEDDELDEAAAMMPTQTAKRGRGRPRKDAATNTRKRPNYREFDEDDLDDDDEPDSYVADDSDSPRASRKRTRRGGGESEENSNSRERPRRRGRGD